MEISSKKKETIYRKDFGDKKSYSVRLSQKKQDGTYENAFINVVFNKGVELDNKTMIMIKNSWLSFYTKDDITHYYIRITDFDIVGYKKDEEKEESKEEVTPSNVEKWESAKNIELEPDDLPFY